MKSRKYFLLITSVLLFLTACAPQAVKIRVTGLVPARFHEATKIKEIAVLPFDGPEGMGFSSELEALLTNAAIGEKPYFTIVDRVRLNQVISEMKLSHSALANPDTAASIGKLVGTKGIYTGVVTSRNISGAPYQENRYYMECGAYNYVKGPYNTQIPICVNWIRKFYTVSCARNTASFSFTVKLVDVETARVVYANDFSANEADQACTDQRAVTGGAELLRRAKDRIKMAFRGDVAPFYIATNVELMQSTEGIKSSEAEKKLKQGMEYAKANRMDRACEFWGEAKDLEPQAPSLLYNLGICSEVNGDLDQALRLFNLSDRAYGKPDPKITAAIYRVTGAIQKQKKLKEQVTR